MEQKGLAVNLAERAERNVMRMKAMLEELDGGDDPRVSSASR